MENKNSNDGFASNFIFFVGLMVAFSVAWPLGILMLLWKFGVFKKKPQKNLGADSKQNLRMEKYKILSKDRGAMSIDYLASAIGVSYETALGDLQKMVAEGQFGPNAYINYIDKTIIINPAAARPQNRASAPGGRATTNNGPTSHTSPPRETPRAKSTAPSAAEKEAQSSNRLKKFLLVFGMIMACFGGLGFIACLSDLGSVYWQSVLSDSMTFLSMAAGGAGCLFYRGFLKKRENRFRIYEAAAMGRVKVPVSELASKSGVSERRCRKDLEAMMEKGLLPRDAYIDQGSGLLILDPLAAREPEPAAEPDGEDRYKSIIREIRKLNDDIHDPDVSARIDEMERLASSIFREVQQKPEKEPQIKSFMSYYLPTTLKLLRSYAQFERSGADGENVRAAKSEIEHILDTLVDGFRKQLDKLYESDAMDISSDIDVLEAMLRRDGLTGDGSAFGAQAQQKKK